jgi:hypothetical protein
LVPTARTKTNARILAPVTSHVKLGGAPGGRTLNQRIKRSTLVRDMRLTSNDAPRGCQERTRGTGSSPGSGPRPGPRREAQPRATTVTQRKRTGMETTWGFLPASPRSCVASEHWPFGESRAVRPCGSQCGSHLPPVWTLDSAWTIYALRVCPLDSAVPGRHPPCACFASCRASGWVHLKCYRHDVSYPFTPLGLVALHSAC